MASKSHCESCSYPKLAKNLSPEPPVWSRIIRGRPGRSNGKAGGGYRQAVSRSSVRSSPPLTRDPKAITRGRHLERMEGLVLGENFRMLYLIASLGLQISKDSEAGNVKVVSTAGLTARCCSRLSASCAGLDTNLRRCAAVQVQTLSIAK